MFAGSVRRVAQANGIALVDAWTLLREGDPEAWRESLSDGLHFSTRGQLLIGQWVAESLVRAGVDPDEMALDFPLAQDLVALQGDAAYPL